MNEYIHSFRKSIRDVDILWMTDVRCLGPRPSAYCVDGVEDREAMDSQGQGQMLTSYWL